VRLLADTHLVLWALAEPARLPDRARDLLDDPANEACFSPISLWETGIKSARGRSDFRVDPAAVHRTLLANGYREIPVDSRHAIEAAALPSIHHDPFDRMLVAQARVEGLVLLTVDRTLAAYPGPIRLV
jgi:PIN domain nuclease of toxin-antitoxin system